MLRRRRQVQQITSESVRAAVSVRTEVDEEVEAVLEEDLAEEGVKCSRIGLQTEEKEKEKNEHLF